MNNDDRTDERTPVGEAEMREAFELVVLSEEKNLPLAASQRARDFRFGVGMILIGLFTAIIGTYPLALDGFMRGTFLVFGLICVGVGAVYVDKSNRRRRLKNPRFDKSGRKDGQPPRLVR